MVQVKSMRVLAGRVRPLNSSALSTAYWLTDDSTKSIADKYRCTVAQVRKLAGPAELIMPPCPVCGKPFTALGRDEAARLIKFPVYPAREEQGMVPVCCGPWVSWYRPLDRGDYSQGEYGGGVIGDRWRKMNGR